MIFVLPETEKPAKVVFEDCNPCPIAHEYGRKISCQYSKIDTDNDKCEMNIYCSLDPHLMNYCCPLIQSFWRRF